MSKRTNAGFLDLTRAVAVVHPHRMPDTEPLHQEEVDPGLLVAAGDASDRASYFDFDETRQPFKIDGAMVRMTMDKKARVFDYRTLENTRTNRAMLTIPPKMRENIAELFGVDSTDDLMITTAMVALADYAAMLLKRENRRLHVVPAPDSRAEERKQLRKQIAAHASKAR